MTSCRVRTHVQPGLCGKPDMTETGEIIIAIAFQYTPCRPGHMASVQYRIRTIEPPFDKIGKT